MTGYANEKEKAGLQPLKIGKGPYQVHVFLIEARGIFTADPDAILSPVVSFSVFAKQKTSSVKLNASQNAIVPFKEHFYFVADEFSLDSQKIRIHLRNHEVIFSDSLIGQSEVDLSFVYSQPDHCVVGKWIVLTNYELTDYSKPAGFLKLSISFQCSGDSDVDLSKFEEIESGVMLPPHIALEPVQLNARIIKVQGLGSEYQDSSIFCEVIYSGSTGKTSLVKLEKEHNQGYWFEEVLMAGTLPNVTNFITIKVFAKGLLQNYCLSSLYFSFASLQNGDYSQLFWSSLYGPQSNEVNDQLNYEESSTTWKGRILLSLTLAKSESPQNITEKIKDYSISDYIFKEFEQTEAVDIFFQVLQAVGVPSEYSVYACRLSFAEFSVCSKPTPANNNQCKWNENLPRKRFEIPKHSKNSIFIYLETENLKKIFFCKLEPEEFTLCSQEPRWISLLPDKSTGKVQKNCKCIYVQINLFLSKASSNVKKPVWSSNIPKPSKLCTLWFNLYQARNIPVTDFNGKSDPYIEVYCSGSVARSSVRSNSLNPMWFEVLKLKIDLIEDENPPILVYVKDEDLLSSETITVLPLFLNQSALNRKQPAYPSWHRLDQGEILCSINLFTQEIPDEYCLKPDFFEALLEINCLGLRNLDSAVGWMPVNKAFVQFDANSLDVKPNQALKRLQTQPAESGPNPTINSVVRLKFFMPSDPVFAPCLSCVVFDYLFHGLSQPQIGTFSINLGELKQQKAEEVYEKAKIKVEDVQIDLNTEDIDSTQMISVLRTSSISIEDAQKGAFRRDPQYTNDGKGKIKEETKPDNHYLQLGYNRKPGDNMKHYRYILEGSLEESEYIEKSIFDEYEIKQVSNSTSGLFFKDDYQEKTVGIFKGLARITKIGEAVEENDEFCRIQRMMMKKNQVVVRVYVASCLNLQSKDSKSESDPYLVLKLGKSVIRADDNYKTNEPNPKFFTCFDLPATLPGPSRLKVQVWDKDDYFQDDKIGETVIDVEDRFFSSKFQRLSEKPLEKRQLFNKCSKVPQGSILLWVEIHQAISIPPIIDISEKPPAQFSLRLIVWQTAEISSFDIEDTSDLYIKVTLNNEEIKETDTHYRCQNGSGQFNWRILFNLLLPNESCVINLQAWDRDMLTYNDFIGDCSFTFAQLAKEAFENSERVVMKSGKDSRKYAKQDTEKFWLDLKKSEKVVGKVEISFEIVPPAFAKACPVGEGRSEPNIDPYLPDPSGRFEFTLNPCKLITQTCGPKFRCKILCALCCIISIYLLIMVGPSLLGGLLGNILN